MTKDDGQTKVFNWVSKMFCKEKNNSSFECTFPINKSRGNVKFQKKKIDYDPHLIKVLRMEHQELLRLYLGLFNLTIQKEYSKMPFEMYKFKYLLKEHCYLERQSLYPYLESQVNEGVRFEIYSTYLQELSHIESTMMDFVTTIKQKV